jgi:hypothetical protein
MTVNKPLLLYFFLYNLIAVISLLTITKTNWPTWVVMIFAFWIIAAICLAVLVKRKKITSQGVLNKILLLLSTPIVQFPVFGMSVLPYWIAIKM